MNRPEDAAGGTTNRRAYHEVIVEGAGGGEEEEEEEAYPDEGIAAEEGPGEQHLAPPEPPLKRVARKRMGKKAAPAEPEAAEEPPIASEVLQTAMDEVMQEPPEVGTRIGCFLFSI